MQIFGKIVLMKNKNKRDEINCTSFLELRECTKKSDQNYGIYRENMWDKIIIKWTSI